MQIFLAILIALLVAACACWLVRKMLRPRTPAEPADEPFADAAAPLKRDQKNAPVSWSLKNRTLVIFPKPTLREAYNLWN